MSCIPSHERGRSRLQNLRMNEIIGGRMVDGGAMKYADLPAEESASCRLNYGDVIFNRTKKREGSIPEYRSV